MAKNMKIRRGNDGFSYPYTSPDLVIDENGKSATTKFNELEAKIGTSSGTSIDDVNTSTDKTWSSSKIDSQFKDIANKYNAILTRLNELGIDIGNVDINSIVKLNDNWKFNLISTTSNTNYNSVAEAVKTFNDNTWQTITVPHDWSIYLPFNANSLAGSTGGFLDGGDAWYRRKIDTSKYKDKKVFIYFDGVYMESDVYINGTKVGESKNGYNPFYFDITEQLNFDGNDILAVFVRNNQPSSRWYSGSGIYRNVYLVVCNKVFVGINDVFVTTPNLETELNGNGIVNTNIALKVNNTFNANKEAIITNAIYYNDTLVNKQDKTVTLSTGINTINDVIPVSNPNLWDIWDGKLYKLKTSIKIENTKTYEMDTVYGYRYFKFDKDTGFYINGENTKLHGFCMHHDLGCLGSEVNYSAIERQVKLLKEIGCNSIRMTHNPSSPEMLDICAKEGILVIEELFDVWTVHKVSKDYATYFLTDYENVIKTTINRSKNNPAVIMWSLGNEIFDVRSDKAPTQDAVTTITALINAVKAIDNTRPLTCGDNQRGTNTTDIHNQVNDLLDVVGFNYYNSTSILDTQKTNNPNWCMYISESTSCLESRGIYAHDDIKQQCSSYDIEKVGWGMTARDAIKLYESINYIAGYYPWTGFDYIGEPTPFLDDSKYPSKSSYFGAYDLCGFPKDMAYIYKARWTSEPMVHILPHWNWNVDDSINIVIYHNCKKIELFHNGVSLGKKTSFNTYGDAEYTVKFVNGVLVANGYDENDNLIAQDIIYTSKSANKINLTADKSSVKIGSDDLVFITCDVVDENGVICPNADNEIQFNITGGTIVGVDNGDPTSVENMKDTKRKAFSGKCLCVVKPNSENGNIVITATSDGLTNGTITILKSSMTNYANKIVVEKINATNPPLLSQYVLNVPLRSIVLDSTELSVSLTNPVKLTYQLIPSVTTQTTVTWESSNTNVATVENGLVTGVGIGNCIITCKSVSNLNVQSTCNITVVGSQASVPEAQGYTLYLDASNHGEDNNVWKDLSGNGYDLTLKNFSHDGTTDGWINGALLTPQQHTKCVYAECTTFNPFANSIRDFEMEAVISHTEWGSMQSFINLSNYDATYGLMFTRENAFYSWNAKLSSDSSKSAVYSIRYSELTNQPALDTYNTIVWKLSNGVLSVSINGTIMASKEVSSSDLVTNSDVKLVLGTNSKKWQNYCGNMSIKSLKFKYI